MCLSFISPNANFKPNITLAEEAETGMPSLLSLALTPSLPMKRLTAFGWKTRTQPRSVPNVEKARITSARKKNFTHHLSTLAFSPRCPERSRRVAKVSFPHFPHFPQCVNLRKTTNPDSIRHRGFVFATTICLSHQGILSLKKIFASALASLLNYP